MAALTTGVARQTKHDELIVRTEHEVKAGAVCLQGGIAMADANGFVLPATDTAAQYVVGIFEKSVTGGSASGDKKVGVLSGGAWRFAASSVTRAMLNTSPLMYVVDDNTVDETSPANSLKAGFMIAPFISTTEIWLQIPVGGMRTYAL